MSGFSRKVRRYTELRDHGSIKKQAKAEENRTGIRRERWQDWLRTWRKWAREGGKA